MPANPQKAQEILLPVRPGFVAITLIAGFFLNLLPLEALHWARPDFVAVLLLYWSIHHPSKAGIGTGWFLGVLMDVADATLFGQHAAAYSILTFLGLAFSRRVRMFDLEHQMLHILPMLLSSQVVMVLVGLSAKGTFPGWLYFGGAVTSCLLWPLLAYLLELPQRPKPDTGNI